MSNRRRTIGGQFRTKRGDTLIGTIEEEYGVDFKVRKDMKLTTYLNRQGLPSLARAMEKVRRLANA